MNKNQLLIVNIAALFLILFLSSINLNTRIRKLEQENRDLQWEVEEHELSIQRMAEKIQCRILFLWISATMIFHFRRYLCQIKK